MQSQADNGDAPILELVIDELITLGQSQLQRYREIAQIRPTGQVVVVSENENMQIGSVCKWRQI